MTGVREDRFQIAWLDRKGEQVGAIGSPGVYGQTALSPDEKQVAVVVRSPETQWDLWVIDASRGAPSRLTSGPRNEFNPVWSPDGEELAFNKPATDGINIYRMGLRGGASAEPLLESPGYDFPTDWSRDGGILLYERAEVMPNTEASLWALALTGDEPPELVARQAGFRLVGARLSPDGRWLAYFSDESGEWDVYVQPFRRPGERMRVSLDGGRQPMWRADGGELFYTKLDGPLMAVAVSEVAGTLELGLPVELFDVSEMWSPAARLHAASADGQRFLAKLPVEGGRKPQMHVVVNWESLLE